MVFDKDDFSLKLIHCNLCSGCQFNNQDQLISPGTYAYDKTKPFPGLEAYTAQQILQIKLHYNVNILFH